jgi:tetratricopeptide (TPR) repeat protein
MRRVFILFCIAFPALAAAGPQQSGNEALAQKAVDAERRGDFAGAASAFQQLIHNGADTPELRNNLGIAYFQLQQYAQALQQFRIALAKDPGSVPANLFSGLALMKLQRPKEAVTFLRRANAAHPGNPDVLVALAQAEVATGALSPANVLFKKATDLRADDADAWYGLGITDRALAEERLKASGVADRESARKLMDAANAALARAVQLDPNAVSAYMILGESFRIAEQYDEAVEAYKAATDRKPDFAPAWAGLAVAYSAAGKDEQALQAARRALSLDSHDAPTNILIAATYLRQSDVAKAKEYVQHALELQPDLSSAHVVLAKIALQEHEPEKALPELRAAVKDDLDGSTYYLLATTLRQLGKSNEAAAAMQQYKRLHAAHIGTAAP